MGKEWAEAQLAKPREGWHALFRWYAMTCEYQKQAITVPGQLTQLPMIGAACGIMWLTYALYLLRHNADVQLRLLQRLRAADPVQVFGALHEVIISAAMIRAGFTLDLENEADGTQSHCEFVATSKSTGRKFSVEVKVCDPGSAAGATGRNRVLRQLSGALAKKADHPRIVCIDLNRPIPADMPPEQLNALLRAEMGRLHRHEHSLQIIGSPAPAAYVMLSNFPFRYALTDAHFQRIALLEGFKIPQFAAGIPFTSLRTLSETLDEHADPLNFMRAFAEMVIPTTLDGDLPSRAFGGRGEPILVGERYMVKDADGQDVAGEVLSAMVDEQGTVATAVLRLNDGSTILARMPLTQADRALFRDSPDTFFGVYDPKIEIAHPVELYRWLLSVYRHTSREKLLEFLAGHPNIELLRELPQLELAKIYAEGMANSMPARTQ